MTSENPYGDYPSREAWEAGYRAGFESGLNALEKNLNAADNIIAHGGTPEQIINRLKEAASEGEAK